jgi:hypothetical protein
MAARTVKLFGYLLVLVFAFHGMFGPLNLKKLFPFAEAELLLLPAGALPG